MDPKKSGNCCSKDDSARTNIDESLANVDPILVTDYNKMLEQANDRVDQTSGIAGETMLKDTRSKGDRTDKIGGKNESSAINCSTYLFGASEMVPTITHADEASFHNLRGSPGVARALHTKTNLSPDMSSNSYELGSTSSIKGDKNVEVERISGCTLEIQEIFSGATCISQSISVPVESFDPIRLYVSDKEAAAANSVVAKQTVDNSGVAHQYDVDSLEAGLKSLRFGLKEGVSVPPSPIRGLIQELPSPNLLRKQHNQLDSHNEKYANFSFGLENKSGNDSSGNTFKKASILGTEDESEFAKSNIDNKYKHFDPEEKLLVSSSHMTKDKVASSNFVLPYTESFLRFSRKKLIVLDLNGLLADINRARTAHKRVGGKSVFKRPFCDDFLKFCFERFNVGVWSSRRRDNVDSVVDYLMGDLKHKLLFCWDQSKCTDTGRVTIDNIHKPLVLKELNKLWNKDALDLPWKKGEYSASNTLLIDDSPYKAICNPPHTAIFPDPYSFTNKDDNSLGPEGDLRLYLEGLAMADDVRVYVQAFPFGQQPITDTNPSWKFYLQIINKIQNSSSAQKYPVYQPMKKVSSRQLNKAIHEQIPVKSREAVPAMRRKLPELSERLLDGPNPPNTPLGGLKTPDAVPGVFVTGVELVPAELEKEKFDKNIRKHFYAARRNKE